MLSNNSSTANASRIFFGLACSVVAAWLWLAPSHAAADDARTHFLRGQTAYQQGAYESALHEWETAYKKEPKPLLQYNMAQAYERMGKIPEAVVALEKYVSTADPSDAKQVEGRAKLGVLKERLQQTGIRIIDGPDGAGIWVDGQTWGRLPRPDPIHVNPGSHQVVVRHSGFVDFSSLVVVNAGQRVEVPVRMQLAPKATVVTVTEHKSSNVVPWVLVGTGAAFVATGAVIGIIAGNKADSAPTQDGSAASSAKTMALVADISMGAGIVAAGVGIVLLLTNKNETSVQKQTKSPVAGTLQMSPWIAAHGGGARALIRF